MRELESRPRRVRNKLDAYFAAVTDTCVAVVPALSRGEEALGKRKAEGKNE